jgi:glutamine amidotransferase
MQAVIIDYGAGNVKSLQFALERLGVSAPLTSDPETVASADKVFFPGQGEASNAMQKLATQGLIEVIQNLTQPVLGICLGMQLLCEHTEEGNTKGLALIKGEVQRFPNTLKVPQMGWNTITFEPHPLFKHIANGAYMYLVHSYYVPLLPETIAQSHYNENYSVALQKDNFYGVQFHPEKSSAAGQQLLANFLDL